MPLYDLRSDTVTLPTSEMRKAISKADLGDDVYGEDPTVNRLQEMAAKITGKKAALFVPSGSMGNLIPIFLNCGRGNEVLAHERAHILHYEMASITAIAGAMPVPVIGDRGILTPDALTEKVRPGVYSMPRTAMVAVENTHNAAGGTCYTLQELKDIYDFAKKNDLKMHMDGARIFNAALAVEESAKRLCAQTDTVTFCLSKGLGAPVGSVLCGPQEFIDEARRIRKMLGGGMRQAGILAAAGIYALENNIERLAEDHANAKKLAEALYDCPWAEIDPVTIETNIVFFRTSKDAETIAAGLKRKGILCGAPGPRLIRMVTNLGITTNDIDKVCTILRESKF
jgi:threonine aldolase